MDKHGTRVARVALSGLLFLAAAAYAAPEDGEHMLTPNQQRNIETINHDLTIDVVGQAHDSSTVTRLRQTLRQSISHYKDAVTQFGNGTLQARKAGHEVVDAHKALHDQFIREEATPAISMAVRN